VALSCIQGAVAAEPIWQGRKIPCHFSQWHGKALIFRSDFDDLLPSNLSQKNIETQHKAVHFHIIQALNDFGDAQRLYNEVCMPIRYR
jgi:hypothetical protein